MNQINIEYFAILREQAGVRDEALQTDAVTVAQLYEQLQARHGFVATPATLKVAINDEFSDWDAPLKHNDTVVFIPPVAGG